MNQRTIIFIGPSGSGKGTQAQLILETLKKADSDRKVLYIQSGQELREFMKQDNYLARRTKETLDEGGLMPSFMPIFIWGSFLVKNYSGVEHLVFDGTPRRLIEAEAMDSMFTFFNLEKPVVIYLDVPQEETVRRLMLRKRYDDTEEDIRKRLSWYHTEVEPALNHFRNREDVVVLDIDGNRPIEEIHEDIVKKIGLA
jgi:adenylate kinase family enzyme